MVTGRWRSWWSSPPLRRTRRILGWILLGLLAFLLLVILLVVLPPGRAWLLETAVGQAGRFAPGTWTVGEVSWPEPGRLEIRNLVWRTAQEDTLPGPAHGDTLAAVEHVLVEVDLLSLRRGIVQVSALQMDAGPVEVPAILLRLPQAATAVPDTAAVEESSSFLAEGSLPGVPAVRVDSLSILGRRILLPGGAGVREISLDGLVETREGKVPELKLRGALPGATALVGQELYTVVADRLQLEARANPTERRFHLESLILEIPDAGPDTMRQAWREAGGVSLEVKGGGHWTDTGLAVELEGQGNLPGPDHVRPLLPPQVPAEFSGPLVGHFRIAAEVPDLGAPDPRVRLHCDFSRTAWVQQLVLAAALEGGTLRADTLTVDLLGVRLEATGSVDTLGVEGLVDLEVRDGTALEYFAGDGFQGAEVGLVVSARAQGSWPIPEIDLEARGHLLTADHEIPDLTVTAHADSHRLGLELALPGGLVSGSASLDSLRLDWQGTMERAGAFPYDFSLGVWSPQGRLLTGGGGLIDTVRTMRLDSLVVTGLDSTMRTRGPALLTMGPGPREMRLEDLSLEGGLGTLAVAGGMDDGGIDLDLHTDLLLPGEFLDLLAPAPLWSRKGGADVSLKARLALAVDESGPLFEGQAGVGYLPRGNDPRVGADLVFALSRGQDGGLGAEITVAADEQNLLQGSLLWPGQADLDSQAWVPDPGRGLELVFPSQEIDLNRLQPFLPEDVTAVGRVVFNLEARQAVVDSAANLLESIEVAGHLETHGLELTLPERSRIALGIRTDLAGPALDPSIRGVVEVHSGFFNLPEVPPLLLPAEGASFLWQAMATADSLALAAGDTVLFSGRVAEAPPAAPFMPDLDVEVKVPGRLFINGYGLNAELEGDLRVQRGVDRDSVPGPMISGQMGLVDGTLKFMNRVFKPEKATIHFNRAVPPNPHLDLLLAAEVSGYRVMLAVTGFADDPQIVLSSEPSLDESDIVAVLLFGQPLNDLDNDLRGQVGGEKQPADQLKQNLAAMAVMFGGRGVQNRLTSTLNVDMVDLGSDSEGGSTLVVGKFLTPRILLKYNQSLEKSGTYFMTLEYTLSRYFRLLSTYGEGEEGSGLELKWIRRS